MFTDFSSVPTTPTKEVDVYRPSMILSKNIKTVDPSINLPVTCCRPSSLCRRLCYARHGRMSMPNHALKAEWVSSYLLGGDVSALIDECRRFPSVRLNGSGDFLPGHVPAILEVAKACPSTAFWGFSRKPEICESINDRLGNLHLTLSVDGSTPPGQWADFPGEIAFGPRLQSDVVPDDARVRVVFPYHHRGAVIRGIPTHRLDCPAVRSHSVHCNVCRHCFPPQWRSRR